MSAIIAGNACKKCGKKYWISFGHPKWYDDVIKRRAPKNETFLQFEKMARSDLCFKCFISQETLYEKKSADQK